MKKIHIALMTLLCLSCYAENEISFPFDSIITSDLLIQFSTLVQEAELEVKKEEKDGVISYSAPLSGLSIEVGPAYSLLPKGQIEEDRKAIKDSNRDLEKALEAKKIKMGSEEDEETKKSLNLFTAIFAGSEKERYPDLGSQALHTGWTDGDTTTFTTSDRKYDLRIQRMFTEEVFFRIPEMAQFISNTYDKTKTQPGGR
ncbi:MAG: hypothetical protein AAF065_14600 [Verrucomicrobiota bacterium]